MAKRKFDWNAAFIPGYGYYLVLKNMIHNIKTGGFQIADLNGLWKQEEGEEGNNLAHSANDVITDTINNHGLDDSGNIEINPADPTSSAANIINHDPTLTAQGNLLNYALANNSASAYSNYLQNQHAEELSNSAISRAVADAERNGISKYQLFQSGNVAASTPVSGSSMYQSYENALNRRSDWNEKELAAITAIVATTINSAFKLLSKV